MRMRKLKNILDGLIIPNNVRLDFYLYRKSIVLAYVNLFLTVMSLLFAIATFTIMPENKDVPTILGLFLGVLLLFIFKKLGNLTLSGNLLAAFYFLIVAPSVFKTGGLFSDNLLWLVLTPLVALLFANKRSGYFWLAGLLLFTIYLFYSNPSDKSVFFNSRLYYFLSYFFLFVSVFGIIIIFKTGESIIITMLNEKTTLLERQKLQISQKNDELELAHSELKLKNIELEVTQAKLIYTNGELENFASAASHDLKEPLRMIGMYTGLSKKRMLTLQDKPTLEYMGYVTDGVDRMQRLLDDLLQYSRTGKKQEDNKEIDLNAVLFVVISNLVATMKDTHATIVINELPTIEGSTTEMIQLFQNLIANSIKFRKADVIPEIKITATDEGDNYLISLGDNGIGIKKEFHDRVFAIFERLHSRSEFEGSGIGLATCKKIVAGAGGKIWLDSTEGVGTTFYFTFPKPSVN